MSEEIKELIHDCRHAITTDQKEKATKLLDLLDKTLKILEMENKG